MTNCTTTYYLHARIHTHRYNGNGNGIEHENPNGKMRAVVMHAMIRAEIVSLSATEGK
jgi:hypothetical protein